MPSSVQVASVVVAAALAVPAAIVAWSGGQGSVPTGLDRGACPVDPVRVVVSVSQWTDVVKGAVGDCGAVTTIVGSPAVDPHEFEPTVADEAAFTGARLVVVNGAGYDAWADRVVATLHPHPRVVSAAGLAGVPVGGNPHVWYDPATVKAVGATVSSTMTKLLPAASAYLAGAALAWNADLKPYLAAVARVRAEGGGTYAATEPVFDDMAAAVGLRDLTPPGYRRAALNESDPAPGDVAAFERLLRQRRVDLLVVNRQTEGALPAQLRRTAERARVAVVEVSESPPRRTSFVNWQVGQLAALERALAAGSVPQVPQVPQVPRARASAA